MRSLARSLSLALAITALTGASPAHAQRDAALPTDTHSPALSSTEASQAVQPLPLIRIAPVVVTPPSITTAHVSVSSLEQRSHAPPASHSPFEMLSALALIGATSSGGSGGRKTGGSKRASKRGSQSATESTAPTSTDANTVNQSPADVEFNKRTSAGGAAAGQPTGTTAAGNVGAFRNPETGKRWDETEPGGRYRGTDGKLRNAHGELLSDKKSD